MFRPTVFTSTLYAIKFCCRFQCSSKLSSKDLANRRKQINFKSKLLFGPVIRKKVSATTTEDVDKFQVEPSKCTTKIASEVYWLTGHKPIVSQMRRQPSVNTQRIRLKNEMKRIDDDESKSEPQTIQTTRDIIRNLLPKRNVIPRPITIPFTDEELTAIVKYPMYCEKSNENKIKDVTTSKYQIPSISKVLQGTMPELMRNALKKWKLGKIAELGEEGFREYEQENLRTGSLFHLCVENYLTKKQVPDSQSPVFNLWQSVNSTLSALDPKPLMIEKPILHPDLKYKGIIDCVSIIK